MYSDMQCRSLVRKRRRPQESTRMMGILDWRMRDNRLGGLYMDMGTDTRSLEAEVMVGGGIRPSKGSKDLYTM